MKPLLALVVLPLIVVSSATVAWSCGWALPDDTLSYAVSAGGAVFITPAGLGDRLDEVGATVTVYLRDLSNTAMAHFPRLDIWLASQFPSDVSVCNRGLFADAWTDAEGMTTISGRFPGGGNTARGMQVYICGLKLAGPSLDIRIVSCDTDGDLDVDLADVGDFAVSYASPSFDPNADYSLDGKLDLVDVALLSQHFGEHCH